MVCAPGTSCRHQIRDGTGREAPTATPCSGRAVLNGRPYFMRGSNVTVYRFFEDPARGDLPWNEAWVRQLHRRFKEMHWNSLRYCIDFPPELWYRIADEEGLLIQDEYPLWNVVPKPGDIDTDVLAGEFPAWLQERWNHPSVVNYGFPASWHKTPAKDLTSQGWKVCSPQTVPNFSGVLYFFGQRLRKELNVPVGLVNSSWGGTGE